MKCLCGECALQQKSEQRTTSRPPTTKVQLMNFSFFSFLHDRIFPGLDKDHQGELPALAECDTLLLPSTTMRSFVVLLALIATLLGTGLHLGGAPDILFSPPFSLRLSFQPSRRPTPSVAALSPSVRRRFTRALSTRSAPTPPIASVYSPNPLHSSPGIAPLRTTSNRLPFLSPSRPLPSVGPVRMQP